MPGEVSFKPKCAVVAAVQLPSVSDLELEASLNELREMTKTLGFEVVAETASPAALEDEIEVFADELVALNDALGEKKTTVKAIRSWLAKTHPNDLAAQAAEIKKRVEDKRAKVASLSSAV